MTKLEEWAMDRALRIVIEIHKRNGKVPEAILSPEWNAMARYLYSAIVMGVREARAGVAPTEDR